jgi:hypothetical protein
MFSSIAGTSLLLLLDVSATSVGVPRTIALVFVVGAASLAIVFAIRDTNGGSLKKLRN